MKKSFRVLLLTLCFCISRCVQCHELLNDFLEFNDESSRSYLTKTCVDDLTSIRSGIEKNNVWALKGKFQIYLRSKDHEK